MDARPRPFSLAKKWYPDVVRHFLLCVVVAVAVSSVGGCGDDKNKNPYHNVTPQKVKQQVEKIQANEEQRNERKLDEMK
jgi:hypothetical protein